jgi:hypothetical protein
MSTLQGAAGSTTPSTMQRMVPLPSSPPGCASDDPSGENPG